jgi:ketosteroid isomerase-like protein
MRAIVLSLILMGCASTQSAAPLTPDPVIAAERAFAARAGVIGWAAAFREYSTADAELGGRDGYANVHASLADTADDGGRLLFWWPAFAGISRSGDLGFTTGVVSFDEARTPRGHYFTVWRLQADGSWKWVYDGGVGPIANPALIEPDAAHVPTIEVARRGASDRAVAEVEALERAGQFAFASDGLSYRSRAERAAGRGAPSPGGITYRAHRTEVSAAGDLVAVIGEAQWPADAGEVRGFYARVWQLRAEGWRVVYDQLILPQPAPPPG